MIISITESCHMGCSHCMDDARPCDKHMSMRTFQDAISFFNQFGGIECLITGGEPTDNPEWIKMLEYALEHAHGSTGTGIAHITLTTNAMNIANNRDIQTYLLLLMQRYPGKLNIQVTHIIRIMLICLRAFSSVDQLLCATPSKQFIQWVEQEIIKCHGKQSVVSVLISDQLQDHFVI